MTLRPYNPNHLATVDGEVVHEERQPLTQVDYEKLKDALARIGTRRDVLLCKMLRATGVRITELLGSRVAVKAERPSSKGLTPERIGKEGPDTYILVWRGKKKVKDQAWERLYLPPSLAEDIDYFIKGNKIGLTDLLFPISRQWVFMLYQRAGRLAIGRPINPHELRALYNTYLIQNMGVPLEIASKMLGHSSIETTRQHYYSVNRDLKQKIQREIPV